jgi:hypothetical protein
MSNTATMFLNVNGAPSFGTNALFEPTANANQPYSISVAKKVSDANPGDSFIFSKVTGPAWLTVSSSGLLSGTPAASDAGTNSFTIKVTDSGGLFATTIVYVEVNGPPSFLSDPFTGPAVTVGQLYSATVATQAVDPNANTTLTFSKLSGPSWLSIGPDGSLSGVPSAQDLGTNSFTVKVADASGLNGMATMYVSVLPVSPLQIQTQIQSNLLYLTWSGGNPPFQVQSSTNLSAGPWQNVGAAFTNRTWTAVPTSTMAVFRVLGSP